MKKIKLGIVGLSVIGASIFDALKDNNDYELYIHSNSGFNKVKEFVKQSSNDIRAVKGCDIVFVCTKLSQTLETLDKLNQFLDKNTLVVDVASSKKELLNKTYNYTFLLSHPMAGSEKTGFEAKDKELFKGARWLFEQDNEVLLKVIKDLGAIPLKISMAEHDSLCAQISHLPTLLSFLLFDCASDNAKKIASSGFRDTTRLAMTNSDLILSMLKTNEENILSAYQKLTDKLNYLQNLSDNEKIKLFEEISRKRKAMYDKNGKNIFEI